MRMQSIPIEPLDPIQFAPFGQVIDLSTAEHFPINNGMTERYHDLASIELAGEAARPLLSVFRGQPYQLPLTLTLVERHPLGSQAFYPLHPNPFLVITAPDENGIPGTPRAFLTAPNQGVNIGKNVWHGVLTALHAIGDFIVVDRGGSGNNLEEYTYPRPFLIER